MYKQAGVDIDLAHKLLGKVKKKMAATRRPEMLVPIGGFGGLFQIDLSRYKKPVLVSSIDGVGTKLMVAAMMEKYDSIGHDIVNHCVNDIAVQGAEPLYFLDYIGIGKLRSPLYEHVLSGIADACKKVNCSVLGGETAEMPGMYGEDFDLVGVITGVVEKDRLINGTKIKPGHIAIGLPSNGLHTNGYSLARSILFEKCDYGVDTELRELNGDTIGEALLKPHTCYWAAIKAVMEEKLPLHGIAHITGGGLYDNVPRILPPDVDVIFDKKTISVPPIFSLIVDEGQIEDVEAYRVFNMGVGMVLFVPPKAVNKTLALCKHAGFSPFVCGEVVKGKSRVEVK
ncbi:MAG: phosphoribosylformylglycinamidine cyclo-ligase [Lentisphaerae bacterium GWF2_52_8]|nr:MAG: phosphoribosylformylglycinamidine cyclo-ligase [Lentisphaerae bacterium GWF2_52_8]